MLELSKTELKIWQKNTRGLKDDDRMVELLTELSTLPRDFVSLNETWRGSEREYFEVDGCHVFCGAGGEDGARGVAILVNKR